ncbi:MAG TPA: ABC transporter substrate-binding protein [Methylomirabilota bacterium]|nr:ABC transporter substrate-binding protein [Methylomirabilota bacterium]
MSRWTARRAAVAAVLLIGALTGGALAAVTPLPAIGYLANEPTPDSLPVLRAALRERAWVEGRSIELWPRYAQGKPELYATQADELARLDVAVIVAVGVPAIEAARRATKTIPIVMVSPDDPAAAGLVGDPAAGSNLTGLTTFVPELSARRLELLRQVVPDVARVAVVWNPASGSAAVDLKATQAAAQAQSIEIVPFEVKGDSDVREVFVKIKEQRVQALVVLADALTLARREAIAKAASRNGLPSVFALRDFVDAGGLISYGATWTDVFRQAAGFVDQILRGARPADLPLARASRFELIVNLRTARSISVPIPLPLLRRADRVIQ